MVTMAWNLRQACAGCGHHHQRRIRQPVSPVDERWI